MNLDFEKILKKIGSEVIHSIIDNSTAGKDKHGKPFKAYSSNTFSMPAGAAFSSGWKTTAKVMQREKLFSWFNKNGKKWAAVKGGYKALKTIRFGQDNVNLQVRGVRGKGMLGSLVVIGADKDSVTIGFSNPEAARLAVYHEIMGAGKAKVIRQFMGLPAKEMQDVINKFMPKIMEVVKNGFILDLKNKID